MPNCFCSRCKGAQVSSKTFRRHIPTFAQWKLAQLELSHQHTGALTEGDDEEEEEHDMDLSEEHQEESPGEDNMDDRLTKRRRINSSTSPAPYHNPSPTGSTGFPELSSDSDTSIIDPLRESSSDESARAQPIAAQAGPAFGGLNEDSDVEDEDEVHAPDVAPLVAESEIEDIRVIQEFNESNQTATLANGKLEGLAIPRLQNHIQVPLDISDEDVRLSLDLYLAATNSSEDTYQAIREATLRRFPGVTVLSLDAVKVLVRINSALPRTSMHSSDKAMPAFPSNNNAFNVANNSTSLGSQDSSSNGFVISDSALNGSSFVDSDSSLAAVAASVASSTHVELSIKPVAQSVNLASSSSLPQCQTSNAIKFSVRGPMKNPNVSGASTSLNAASSKLTTRSALTQTARLQLKRKGK